MNMNFREFSITRLDRDHLNFYILVFLIIAAFFLGGASRGDVISLVLLRPLTAIVLVYAIFAAGRAALQQHWQLVVLAVSIIVLVASHLVPLPGEIWKLLPGREIIAANFFAVGQELPWLPLSLTPLAAWNALFSMMGPFAALLLVLALPQRQVLSLLKVALVLGAISALLGLAQILGPPKGSLYLYRITNNGLAVGLFANRNHHAVFLATLFPLMALWLASNDRSAEKSSVMSIAIIAMGAFIFPLLLATGSRAGLLLGIFALIASAWIYRPPIRQFTQRYAASGIGKTALLAFGLITLASVIIMVSRAPALQRLFSFDTEAETRIGAFQYILEATLFFFPVGSGFGSFSEVYKIFEPRELLSPYYLNHAHNDILEVIMTGGLPAIIIMLISIGYFIFGFRKLSINHRPIDKAAEVDGNFLIKVGRCGAVGIIILALASVADYPLRTPSLSILLVVFVSFIVMGCQVKQSGSLN